jgi:hypothetical protein
MRAWRQRRKRKRLLRGREKPKRTRLGKVRFRLVHHFFHLNVISCAETREQRVDSWRDFSKNKKKKKTKIQVLG